MEKVKYGGQVYDLVPGGFGVPDNILTIRHQLSGKTLEEIKAIAKTVTATDSIDLLDKDGKLMQSVDGFIYAGRIQEIDDYCIETLEMTSDHTLVQTEEIRADIVIVTFKFPDVREELEKVKAVQDEIIVAMLEGGV